MTSQHHSVMTSLKIFLDVDFFPSDSDQGYIKEVCSQVVEN